MILSFITTTLQVDEELLETARSVQCAYEFEHIITVARPVELIGGGFDWPVQCRLMAIPGCDISTGFNAGIERASGDYICILNSGDRMRSVDALVEHLRSHPDVAFAYGDVIYDGHVVKARERVTLATAICHGMGFNHGAVVFRRSLHKELGWYKPEYRICMDMDFVCRILASGKRGVRLPIVAAEITKAGVSGRITARSWENYKVIRGYRGRLFSLMMFLKWNITARVFGS